MAVLGPRLCARAFSSCGKRGPLFIAVRGPLTIAASLVAEHRLQTRRLSNCGLRAHLLRGMRDPPRPGVEPVSPALAGRLSTTAPTGKPWIILIANWTQLKNFHELYNQITRNYPKWKERNVKVSLRDLELVVKLSGMHLIIVAGHAENDADVRFKWSWLTVF